MGVSENTQPQNPSVADWLGLKDKSSILLLPAHPNPASNSENISFTIGLRERAGVTLKLYDLLGREQSVILNDLWHPEGIFDAKFNSGKLAAGTYVYRLEALGEVRSGRIVVKH